MMCSYGIESPCYGYECGCGHGTEAGLALQLEATFDTVAIMRERLDWLAEFEWAAAFEPKQFETWERYLRSRRLVARLDGLPDGAIVRVRKEFPPSRFDFSTPVVVEVTGEWDKRSGKVGTSPVLNVASDGSLADGVISVTVLEEEDGR